MPVTKNDGRPDVDATFRRFQERVRSGAHEEAFEDAVWYWEHALEYEPAHLGVRSSFFLGAFVRFAAEHEPAREYLEEHRAGLVETLRRGEIDARTCGELFTLDAHLGGDVSAAARFEELERLQPELAARMAQLVWRQWYADGEWELIERYPPNVDSELGTLLQMRAAMPSRHESLRPQAEMLREVYTRLGRPGDAKRIGDVFELD